MPVIPVRTALRNYDAVVRHGALQGLAEHLPGAGKVFVVSTPDVWELHGDKVVASLAERPHGVLLMPGGEERKRLAEVEALAERMATEGGDRSSVVVAFGGGIVNDMGGFLAASYMRGIPVVQVPTTLLAQVDSGVGGKTGVNLAAGKNLFGAFHQPCAVVIDPQVLETLPEREYRAGIYEVIKCGVIADRPLFDMLEQQRAEVLERRAGAVERMIADSVRIKAEVVSSDERESGLRRVLNFGHTLGHALEAETGYARFLHGEAVAFGMRAAAYLAELTGMLAAAEGARLRAVVDSYGPIPSLAGVAAENLVARLSRDKKTIQGRTHFVLPEEIGHVRVVTGIDPELVLSAARAALE